MTFKKRQINLQFSNENTTIQLVGLRCSATIVNTGGQGAFGTIQLKVWGMTLSQMNEFSGVGISGPFIQRNNTLAVLAGNEGDVLAQVFLGNIYKSYIDFSTAPEVTFNVTATAVGVWKGTSAKANSYKGAQNAEDIIEGLAKSIGFNFENNGAHAIIQNSYVWGSAIEQMQTIARAAAIPMSIENNTVYIWPNGFFRNNVTVPIGPTTGMIGYPQYYQMGFIVRCEFNPVISIGSKILLTSTIPQANGEWGVMSCIHEISTELPDGPWMTTVTLATKGFVNLN